MYIIEKESYGFHLKFWGQITSKEMDQWVSESKQMLEDSPGGFCVFMDLIECQSMPDNASDYIRQVHELFMEKGLKRSSVVVHAYEMDIQPKIKDSCIETGIYLTCRYIDVKTTPEWKKKAFDWILYNIEPF